MVQRRCQDCREFYDKKLGDCPHCGAPPHQHNKWLRTASLNGHLHDMAMSSGGTEQQKISAYQAAKEHIERSL